MNFELKQELPKHLRYCRFCVNNIIFIKLKKSGQNSKLFIKIWEIAGLYNGFQVSIEIYCNCYPYNSYLKYPNMPFSSCLFPESEIS